jgi:hypothetical protein
MNSIVGVIILLATSGVAQESVPAPSPTIQPRIVFPVVPVIDEKQVPEEDRPEPKPHKGPTFVSELSEETWLVIEAPAPLIVLHSPAGHVAVQQDEGPVRVRGKFADGTGKTETRTFSSKFLYFVNALKPGKIELLIVPDGVKSESEVMRQTLTVMGIAPIPPPEPSPEPEPEPSPEPEPGSGKISISIVEDALNRTADTAIVLNAVASWNDLRDKGHDWRFYDKATTEAKGKQAIADAAGEPLPVMVVRDKETDKVLRVLPLPKTFADVKRVLSELTGGL